MSCGDGSFLFVFFLFMIRRPPGSTQSRSSAASDVFMIRMPPRSKRSSSSASSDVYKRHV